MADQQKDSEFVQVRARRTARAQKLAFPFQPPAVRSCALVFSTVRYRGPSYSRMIFESRDGAFTVLGVAFVITIGEPRLDFPQIARPDRLTAQCTERLPAGRPAIDQDESHVAPPNAKENTVSDEWKAPGAGAPSRFLSSGLSLFISSMLVPSSLLLRRLASPIGNKDSSITGVCIANSLRSLPVSKPCNSDCNCLSCGLKSEQPSAVALLAGFEAISALP